MKCTINQKIKILEQIEDLLLFSNAPTKESIESEIRQSGESEFTFSGFLSNLSEEEITNLTDIIESLGVSSSDFFTKNNIIITRNVSAIIPKLTNHGDVLSIFHNQPQLSGDVAQQYRCSPANDNFHDSLRDFVRERDGFGGFY